MMLMMITHLPVVEYKIYKLRQPTKSQIMALQKMIPPTKTQKTHTPTHLYMYLINRCAVWFLFVLISTHSHSHMTAAVGLSNVESMVWDSSLPHQPPCSPFPAPSRPTSSSHTSIHDHSIYICWRRDVLRHHTSILLYTFRQYILYKTKQQQQHKS